MNHLTGPVRYVVNVSPECRGAMGEITFDKPILWADNRTTFLTYKESVVARARECYRTGERCLVSLKQSYSGNWRVEQLEPAHE